LSVGGQVRKSGGRAGRAWAVEGRGAVGAGGGDGAGGEQHDAPAPPVHGDQVVERAQQQQIGQAGGAAVRPGQDVVRLAGGRGLGAAGGAAAPVPGDHQPAEEGGDGGGGGGRAQGEGDRPGGARHARE